MSKEYVAGAAELNVLQVFLRDYTARFHVRKVAELLNMSHSTAALALGRLSKRNILKCETAGRNKNYFLNPGNIMTKNYLAICENIKAAKIGEKYFIIKKMMSELHSKQPHIIKNYCIILFGSYAKETADEYSDIDLMLVGKEGESVTLWFLEFSGRHNKKAHIYYLSYEAFLQSLKKDPLAKEILHNHAVLNDPSVFVDILWRHFLA